MKPHFTKQMEEMSEEIATERIRMNKTDELWDYRKCFLKNLLEELPENKVLSDEDLFCLIKKQWKRFVMMYADKESLYKLLTTSQGYDYYEKKGIRDSLCV